MILCTLDGWCNCLMIERLVASKGEAKRTCHTLSLLWKGGGGRVAEWFKVLDLKSGGLRFISFTLRLNGFELFSVVPSSTPLLWFVNSKLVCLLPDGILKKFMFYLSCLFLDLKSLISTYVLNTIQCLSIEGFASKTV